MVQKMIIVSVIVYPMHGIRSRETEAVAVRINLTII